jgi:O-succinylbenzoic acid--CoA ligase
MAEIRCPLWEGAQVSRAASVLVTSQGHVKYEEAGLVVNATAQRLAHQGWGRGDRIAISMPQDWRYIMLLMAMFRRGLVACPLDPKIPGAVLAERVTQAGACAIITSEGETPDGFSSGVQSVSAGDLVVMFNVGQDEETGHMLDLSAPATVVFTSGSEGRPKAVLHTIGNHYYSALGSNRNVRVRSKDLWLLSLPLYHVGGLGILFRSFLGGAGIVLPDPGEDLVESICERNPTHVSMVPTQLRRFLHSRDQWQDDHSLRAILVGGAPVPESLVAGALALHLPIYTTYGLTEMSSQVATCPPHASPEKRASTGIPLRYSEVRLAPDGEILVRGRTRFAGYVDGDQLAEPFDNDGWYATGDMGEIDSDGFLTVRGRKDHMMISGGENIFPEEIEQALCSLPGIDEAVVVAVPNEEYGERPVAFVRTTALNESLPELARALRDCLPSFKIPDVCMPWPEEIAKNGLKADRSSLTDLARRSIG